MALPRSPSGRWSRAGAVELWMVYLLVFVRGAVNAVDNPARQSFVIEMVGADRVVNAVSLNSGDRAQRAHRSARRWPAS